MLQDLDAAADAAGFWPHAVLSAHTHNYQRYTRLVAGKAIPYIVAGMGGHDLVKMRTTATGKALRTPVPVDPNLTLMSYDDTHFGYLRVIVNATTLIIEFHPAEDANATKTPDDSVRVDLKSRMLA